MKCIYCGGSKRYKKPLNQEEFDEFVDKEMEKGYFINYQMAEEKAYQKVGYRIIDCPYCTGNAVDKPDIDTTSPENG